MKENIRWVDQARVIATFCVIVIHISHPMVSNFAATPLFNWFVSNIYSSMSRFCVPLFFMIIGALMLNRDYKLGDFLKKRVLRILPPFAFWTLLYVSYQIYVVDNQPFELKVLWAKFYHGLRFVGEYHLWFVYPLIAVYLFMPILRKWAKNASNKELLYFVILWVISLIYRLPEINPYLPYIPFENFSGYLGYAVLGCYLDRLNIKDFKIPLLLYVVATVFTAIGTYIWTLKANVYHSFYYDYLSLNVMVQSAGVLLLIKQIKVKSLMGNEIISFMSKYSFGIYLVHIFTLRLLDVIDVNIYFTTPILSVPLTAACCITLSGLIIYLMRKIKFASIVTG